MNDFDSIPINHKCAICFVGPMLGYHPGWVPNPAEILAPVLEKRGYQTILTSSKLNRYLRLIEILLTIIKFRRHIDILFIQVYGGLSFIVDDLASLLGRLLKIPIVMMLHGGAMPDFIAAHEEWTRRVIGRAHILVAPSRYLAEVVDQLGYEIEVINNIIDLSEYPFKLRSSIKPRILWMRTFHEIYNPLMAVEVLANLKLRFRNATLTMAGQEKGMLDEVKDMVIQKGLENSIHFAGFLDIQAKREYFSSHDVFLNTNHIDNMPVSIIEAGAFGVPIVATKVGGVPYLLTHNHDSLLVEDNDVKGAVQAIELLLKNSDLVERLSTHARNLAEMHDWRRIIPKWENIFSHLLETQ